MKLELKGNRLSLGDKEIELTDEQLKELEIRLNPFELHEYALCYFIDKKGEVCWSAYEGYTDKALVKSGKMCCDKKLMEQKALRQNLNDLLWKFTIENGWSEELWEEDGYKWFIANDYSDIKLKPMHDYGIKAQGTIYFITEEIAQRAIDEIVKPYMEEHPDFVW